ncbi:MAG: hypothetical protein HC822_11805 [Oscillochloris sp.]|nr:hypothetical protein [Oscillochloris sp.]
MRLYIASVGQEAYDAVGVCSWIVQAIVSIVAVCVRFDMVTCDPVFPYLHGNMMRKAKGDRVDRR